MCQGQLDLVPTSKSPSRSLVRPEIIKVITGHVQIQNNASGEVRKLAEREISSKREEEDRSIGQQQADEIFNEFLAQKFVDSKGSMHGSVLA